MPGDDRRFTSWVIVAALGCGLVAGVFMAFSSFVMAALVRIPPTQGMAAMQAINVTAINPVFMTVFMGTALVSLVLGVDALRHRNQPGATFVLAGSLFYLVGTMVVTMAFNVPLNDGLAKVIPGSPGSAQVWAGYVSHWTMWNHVRMVAAFLASASFIFAVKKRDGR